MDFYRICTREIEKGPRKGEWELFPDFSVGRSKDLMIRGGGFYAIWDEEAGLWSTDEYDVVRLVDADLHAYAKTLEERHGRSYSVRNLFSYSSNVWTQFRRYMNNISDNSTQLDTELTFADAVVKKGDYRSKRLPYTLTEGDTSAWDELVGTLYSVEERAKIEWAIGCIVAGDAKKMQKFCVFYGPPGSGKGTVLNIIEMLFTGYTTAFDAKALGSNNNQFATEAFKNNPLVAIQQDGDLSNIQDNARLNSIISHEPMTLNEKYKSSYTAAIMAFLLMGTNQPVKISDAKSGIIRRLIDIHPTGVKISRQHYDVLMSRVEFELGAIATKCVDVYREMGKNYYGGYRPLEMMLQTDAFFNFIEANFDVFKEQDGVSLKQAYTLYKEYCNETNIERVLPQYKIRSELLNYFDDFKDRYEIDGHVIRSYYLGFNANKFKEPSKTDISFSLVLDDTVSLLDEYLAEMPAQYHKDHPTMGEIPEKYWTDSPKQINGEKKTPRPSQIVSTILSDLDTARLHFVKVPENLIVIDFDLKGPDGEKSLESNLQAASVWPATYAELSKGGAGVHLHYFYNGDVSELSGSYSEGIEIKTLLGDSSLRRKLTKCNNVPIATYQGVLPKKEKKVISEHTIKSEMGYRKLIAENLQKKHVPGTKPSIDFIKHLLDEAYESGITYDLTDMRAKIIAFAAKSSNRSLECLNIVKDMKFKSDTMFGEDPIPEEDQRYMTPEEKAVEAGFQKEQRLVFFDVEVYPNLFVVCWKYQGDATVVRMINPSASDIELLMRMKLVGFYNRRYDNHILYAAFQGRTVEQLYELSQKIVVDNNPHVMFAGAYGISYADIWDFSSIKQSLKLWEIQLGLNHIELDIPWDQPVPPELVKRVVDYCVNDVLATEATFVAREGDFIARCILAELSGLTVNDTTQRHTAKIIFGNDRNPSASFNYTDLRKDFPGYVFDAGRSHYRGELVGEGGYVHAVQGMYDNVEVYDIASMHPTTIEQLNLFGHYTPNFAALKAARIAIKHNDYDSARSMLNGKLAPFLTDEAQANALSDALKIVINIVYGLTSAKFDNPFRDLRNRDNIVAKRGALFMIDLKHAVEEMGGEVVHIKTDSIKVVNPTDAIREFIFEYGKKYGYDFEHEATYDKFCLVNDAVYIAHIEWHQKAKKIGTWDAVGAQFQHPYVFKTLFSGEGIEFADMCETKQVTKGAIYMHFEHDSVAEPTTEQMRFIGRTGRFVPVEEGQAGGILYRVQENKLYAVSGTKGFLWMEADMAASLNAKIDMRYFEKLTEKAIKDIEKFGEFERLVS